MSEEELSFDIHVMLDENNVWLVSDDITGIYGVGQTVPHALQDYEETLLHFQLDLECWDGELAPHLQEKKKIVARWFRWREKGAYARGIDGGIDGQTT